MSPKNNEIDIGVLNVQIQELWDLLHKNPLRTAHEVTEILQQIRATKKRTRYAEALQTISQLELKALHLIGLAFYHAGNIEKVQTYVKELSICAKHCNNEEYCAIAEHVIAKTEVRNGEWLVAKERLHRILPILEKLSNYHSVQSILIDLSNIEQDRNNYEECMNLLLRAEVEYEIHPTKPRILAIIKSNTSDIFLRLGNYKKALEYITASTEVAKQTNDVQLYSNSLLRLSNVYSRQGETEKQIEKLIESIDVLANQKKDHQIAIRRIALGTAYMDCNDFDKSLSQFQEALDYLTEKNDKKNIAFLYHRLGLLYSNKMYKQRDSSTAEKYFKQAEQMAIDLSMPHFQAAVLESLSEAYSSFELYKESLSILQQSIALEKKIINEKAYKQLHELETRHKIYAKEKEIELLEAHNKMLEVERKQLQAQLSINNQYLFMYKKELNNFKTDINYITKQLDKAENIVKKVRIKLRESATEHETWESYLEVFSQVHPDFQKKLNNLHPTLTPLEVKICVLIRAGLKAEEIGAILSLSERTIENNRFRIRKKLDLKEKDKLDRVLLEI